MSPNSKFSILIPILAPVLGSSSDSAVDIVDDSNMVIPLLVGRIAELEQKLHRDSQVPDSSLKSRLTALLSTNDGSTNRPKGQLDAWINCIIDQSESSPLKNPEDAAIALLESIEYVAALKQETISLQETSAIIATENTLLKSDVELKASEVTTLENQVYSLEKLTTALRSALLKQDEVLTTMKSREQEFKQQAEDSHRQLNAMKKQLSKLQQTNIQLSTELEAMRQSKTQVMHELHATQSKLEKSQTVGEDFQRRFLAERADRRMLQEQFAGQLHDGNQENTPPPRAISPSKMMR